VLEREPNPEYQATERSAEPRWLYQLTPAGEAWREEFKNERASRDAAVR
jgi:DNA-binding PadR family transcriptional regulator